MEISAWTNWHQKYLQLWQNDMRQLYLETEKQTIQYYDVLRKRTKNKSLIIPDFLHASISIKI